MDLDITLGAVGWDTKWGKGWINILEKGADDALWNRYWNGSKWSEWENLGGTLTSGVSVASWGDDRLDVFARGKDYQLMHKWWDGNKWSHWEDLGGELLSAPAAVSWGKDRIDIFAQGMDKALWHKYFDRNASSLQHMQNAPVKWRRTASVAAGQGLDRNAPVNGWSDWTSHGGVLTSSPTVASWAKGRLDVFARGGDNALWHKFWENRWSDWSRIGGALTSAPAAVSRGKNRLDIITRGEDGVLYRKAFDNGWQSWELGMWEEIGFNPMMGHTAMSAPAICAQGEGKLDIFVRGDGGAIYHKKFSDGAWSKWEDIGIDPYGRTEPPAKRAALSAGQYAIELMAYGRGTQLEDGFTSMAGHAFVDMADIGTYGFHPKTQGKPISPGILKEESHHKELATVRARYIVGGDAFGEVRKVYDKWSTSPPSYCLAASDCVSFAYRICDALKLRYHSSTLLPTYAIFEVRALNDISVEGTLY